MSIVEDTSGILGVVSRCSLNLLPYILILPSGLSTQRTQLLVGDHYL